MKCDLVLRHVFNQYRHAPFDGFCQTYYKEIIVQLKCKFGVKVRKFLETSFFYASIQMYAGLTRLDTKDSLSPIIWNVGWKAG
ncbi:hypothetical protein CVD19_14145 [Bacillus sp. T33-2]|nr:hypothetical protein CVD19_14145 [Bacillus sp. T33-2]